jgi:hypothetical protein
MSDPNILAFIRDHLMNGISVEETREILLAAGWPEEDVLAGFDEVFAVQPALFGHADRMASEQAELKVKAERERKSVKWNNRAWKTAIMLVVFGGVAWIAHAYAPSLFARIASFIHSHTSL